MTPHAILVLEDAVADPEVYRAAALRQQFRDLPAGPITFHGMAPIGHSPLATWLETRYSLVTSFEAFRLSPAEQVEPNFIHTDQDMGAWSGILYLNPAPPDGDGTMFWRHLATGAIASAADTPDLRLAEWRDWRDRALWEPWHTVPAAFNRLCLFPSSYFHSRALFDNWGTGSEARLIQLLFGSGVLPCV